MAVKGLGDINNTRDKSMIIDLIGGSYEHRFKPWNNQRTVNWYPKITDQKTQEENKTQKALFPRPGFTKFIDLGGNTVRGLFTARTLTQERCFAVAGITLFEIFYDGSSANLGQLAGMATGSKSRVYMAANNTNQLMIQDVLAGYIFDLSNNVLTQITDPDYPGGTTLDYADGYFLISDNNGRVTFSVLSDGTQWDGLNFFTPTFKPDKVKAIVAYREEVYCFGDETIEIYINDGSSPFSRQFRSSIYNGLTAKDSVAVHQSGMFFLGRGRTGGSAVYLLDPYGQITPISSPAIADRLNTATNEDAEGIVTTTWDGHIFYHLHLPSLNTTLVYDLTTGMWHERQSLKPFPDANGKLSQNMYRGRLQTTFNGINLFSDWWSGKIFKEDNTVSTDDGNIRLLKRTSSVFQNEQKYISVYRLQFDINAGFGTTIGQGSSPAMMLKYSKDGGVTFENEELLPLGTLGSYEERIQVNGLGTARNWVVDIEISDPVDIVLMQAVMTGSMGAF